jgi:signal transduction histidine kinase
MTDLLLIIGSALLGAAALYLVLRVSARRRPRAAARASRPVGPSRRHSMDAREILEKMGEGVLVLDPHLRPTYANTAARDLLGIREEGLRHRLPSEEVAAIARRALEDGEAEQRLAVFYPLPMTLQVRAATLRHEGGVMVVVQDMTEELLAQRVRREFVAHASHELKSPVAGLQALAEAITHAVRENPQAAEKFAERMTRESERLGRLVRDLLDLSKLEEAPIAPTEPAHLSAVAVKTFGQIEEVAAAKEMNLESSIEDSVWVRGDEEQLGTMIQNMLENALRYTPQAGTVRLEVFRRGDEATVSVSDTGIGIPREAHGRVFERFYRVDRARSRDRGGTGLGLAIVKHVAELHGGTVEVESEIGAGSKFSAHLPAIPAKSALETVAS